MRWEDERYVRLYTRNSLDWRTLSYGARGLFALLLREVDRAGVLPLGKHGERGVAAAVEGAWADVEPALHELLADGCILIRDNALVIRNFIEAQEAHASDKSRQRAARERARDGVPTVTDGDDALRNVTPTPITVTPSRTPVTPRDISSRTVTDSHAAPDPVTPNFPALLSVTLSHAVPPVRAVTSDPPPLARALDPKAAEPEVSQKPTDAPRSTETYLAPTTSCPPDLPLNGDARATAETLGLRDVDLVWVSFVGHFSGHPEITARRCDWYGGRWSKWVAREVQDQRTRRAREERYAGPANAAKQTTIASSVKLAPHRHFPPRALVAVPPPAGQDAPGTPRAAQAAQGAS